MLPEPLGILIGGLILIAIGFYGGGYVALNRICGHDRPEFLTRLWRTLG